MNEIKAILYQTTVKPSDTQKRTYKYHVAGPSVVNTELDRMSKQDMARFTPLMFAMSIMVLGCLFGKLSGVLIPLLTVGVCSIWVTGCFVLFGQTMNMIANMLLPLTFIITLSASIHMISHYYRESTSSVLQEDAICNTLRHVGVPIFMTTITTALGLFPWQPAASLPFSSRVYS